MTRTRRNYHGEGSIRQRSDGKYEARYYNADGKRRSLYATTEKDAKEKLRDAQAAVKRGEAQANLRMTVGTYLTEWLETVAAPRIRPRTLESYRQIVTGHLIPAMGNKKLAKLTPVNVQKYLNEKLASGLSKRTVTYHRAILRRALNDAVRHGHVTRNVVTLTDPPGQDHKEQRWLDIEESQRFIQSAREHRLSALWILAITSGMRKGELLGLRWRDIDLDQKKIQVRNQLQNIDGRLQLQPLKTDKSKRTVYLTTIAERELCDHRKMQVAERLRAGEHWQEHDFVFATPIGKPVEPRNLVRAFKQILQTAGLPDVRLHDLRHSAASTMISQGIDIRTVSDVLGHSQITLTLDTYSPLTEGDRRSAAERLDDVYGT